MSTAFVLTGGGSLGAAQVGMLQALHAHGIDPDVLVGTSVGAVNAAYLAGPGTTGERLESLAELWVSMHRSDVFVLDPRRWFGTALRSGLSLFSPEPLRQLVEAQLGYRGLTDARLEVHVIATDLLTGAAAVLTAGPAATAVLASAAVPGLLPPVLHQGRTLVDGGFGQHASLAHADACDVDDIYLLPTGYPCAGRPPSSALGVTLTSLSLLLHAQLIAEVRGYAGRARLHVVPPLCPLAISPADFGHASSLMRRARGSTSEWLRDGMRQGEQGPAEWLGPHDHPTAGTAPSSHSVTRR